MKHDNSKYYLAAIASYCIWGVFSLILKPMHIYPSIDILFYRVFLSAIIMVAIILMFRRKMLKENVGLYKKLSIQQRKSLLYWNIASSFFIAFNWFFFIYIMNHVSVKATALAYLVCPILTVLVAAIVLKEKLNNIQWAAVLISTLACIILSYTSFIDMVYSIIIGLSYALYLVSQRKNRHLGINRFLILSFHIIVSGILLLPLYPFLSAAPPIHISFYINIVIIAIVFTIIPLLFNLYALKELNSSTVGMLLNINPIIGFNLAKIVFKEDISLVQTIAYSMIFFAVILFNIKAIGVRTSSTSQ